ncbi:hypothetical protein ACFYO0_30255 [Streptomyces sp. NPDC006365]|uniref:hypothetical protein n=1 Tax=Streptomyces sp. NPDC006365 TaxID=3364744 RepID=UPI0036C30B97
MHRNIITSEKPSPPRGGGRHVLVVDPDPGVTELLAGALELAGYRVGTAGTSAEGMIRLAQLRFDLVVWGGAAYGGLVKGRPAPWRFLAGRASPSVWE